tara:strand:+ start:316 stop:1557 length:1242 start_codon:yes stop_codon:yes gene_type:complete
MKIVIVGGGNAGCITALEWGFISQTWESSSPLEVELIHDPNDKPIPVGQGTASDLSQLIYKLGFDWYNNPIEATPKTGIIFEDWGKKNHKFINYLENAAMAMHFDPPNFQKYILNSGLFNVIEGRIDDISTIDADFIFDCTGGRLNNDTENYNKLISTVNSSIISRVKGRDYTQLWTRAVTTPDGWTFIIPQTDNTTIYGYVYNNHITDETTARENINKLFNIEPDDMMNRVINFDSFVTKEVISEHRIIKNGNKLAAFDPLEAPATSLHIMVAEWCQDFISPHINSPAELVWKQDIVEKGILDYVHEIETFQLWHYQFGSKYDTPFWDYAKTLADNYFNDNEYGKKFKNRIKLINNFSEPDLCSIFSKTLRVPVVLDGTLLEYKGVSYTGHDLFYGPWNAKSLQNWYTNVVN